AVSFFAPPNSPRRTDLQVRPSLKQFLGFCSSGLTKAPCAKVKLTPLTDLEVRPTAAFAYFGCTAQAVTSPLADVRMTRCSPNCAMAMPNSSLPIASESKNFASSDTMPIEPSAPANSHWPTAPGSNWPETTG